MKIRWLLPVVWLVVLFGTIGASQAAGWWEVSGREDVVAGTLTVDDLKGWMSVQQAADGLEVPVEVVIDAIGGAPGAVHPEDVFKDVEVAVPGFSLDDLREILRVRLSPTPAASPSGSPTPSASPSVAVPSATATHVPQPTGTGAGESSVTGQQTLRQVAQAAGIDLAALIAEAGLPADVNPDVALRTLRDTVPGFEMQQVRDAVDRLS